MNKGEPEPNAQLTETTPAPVTDTGTGTGTGTGGPDRRTGSRNRHRHRNRKAYSKCGKSESGENSRFVPDTPSPTRQSIHCVLLIDSALRIAIAERTV